MKYMVFLWITKNWK